MTALHAMVDIETLGTKPGSVILSIGAVMFDDLGVLGGPMPFYRNIDVFSSLMAGLVIDPATVEWWREQSDAARGALSSEKHSLGSVLGEFYQWLRPAAYVWAKGPDFDLVLLDAAYAAAGIGRPWSYRNTRDVRTILAIAGVTQEPNGTKHHALDDACSQANAVVAAYKALGKTLSEAASA